jgi:hypothetical protein
MTPGCERIPAFSFVAGGQWRVVSKKRLRRVFSD